MWELHNGNGQEATEEIWAKKGAQHMENQMWINPFILDIPYSIMDIHNLGMDIHNSGMDTRNSIMNIHV